MDGRASSALIAKVMHLGAEAECQRDIERGIRGVLGRAARSILLVTGGKQAERLKRQIRICNKTTSPLFASS
jgi:hypothetical protein